MKKWLLAFTLAFSQIAAAQSKSWTVLIYWAVDNDLYEFSIPYLQQFERVPESKNLNLVLEYDYPDKRPNERFHNFKFVEEIGERNSAHPSTLTSFMKWGIETYPADNYLLIIASHGSNWSGVIDDRTSKSYMSLTSLKGALQKVSPLMPKGKFDMVVFDACQMSYLETLAVLGSEMNYLVSSAFVVNGFDHENPLKELVTQDLSVEAVGASYIRHYPELAGNRGEADMGATFMKAREFDMAAFKSFFDRLNEYEVSDLYKSLHKIGLENEDWGFDLVALLRQSAVLIPELQFEATSLIAQIESSLITSSRTPETPMHSGFGITCAEDLKGYRKSASAKMLSGWVSICRSWRAEFKE